MALALDSVTFDCADVMRVARFWADALGWELDPESEPDGARVVRDPSRRSDSLYFQPVPEPKVVKNRLHLDLRASGSMAAEVERLEGLGATVVGRVDEEGSFWTVMQDPEGNELCVLRGPEDGWPGYRGSVSRGMTQGRHDARRRRGPRPRRRHRRDRGLHAPDLLRGRPRDHPPAQARPDPRADDARRRLRPDGRRRGREEADLLLARQPRRRLPPRRAPPDRGSRSRAARDRGVLALRHGLPVRGGRLEPALLPDPQLLRVRHPGGEPEDRPDDLPVRGRLRGLRRSLP